MQSLRSKCARAFLAALLTAAALHSQTTPPAAAPAPALPPGLAGLKFSGLIDGYYSLNTGHPASKVNTWRYFDYRANSLSLSMGLITIERDADPVGFKMQLGFGRAMDLFHATEPAGVEVVKHFLQAYGSVKPKSWKGAQLDFGKFVTSAGAEVTETHLNWNYSRSLLYANGPFYHMGARFTAPIAKNFTAGVQLVNGWNNVEDNNSGKTVGLTGAFTSSKISWFNNYYVGPEKNNTNTGMRHFYDTVVSVTPSEKFNALFNFDYGQDNRVGGGSDRFYGISMAGRIQPTGNNGRIAISPRYDWYKDRDGFITTVAQTMQEFTVTADVRMKEGANFLTRFEYRRDWSNRPFFDRGNEPGSSKSLNTFLIGFVAYFP